MKSLEKFSGTSRIKKGVYRTAPWLFNIVGFANVQEMVNGSVDVYTGLGIGLVSFAAGAYFSVEGLRRYPLSERDFLVEGFRYVQRLANDVSQASNSITPARSLVEKGDALMSEVAEYSVQASGDVHRAAEHRSRLMRIYKATGKALDVLRPSQGTTRAAAGQPSEPFSGPKHQ